MSILQIGQLSRYLQASPGCRKYISPFLSDQQKQDILKQKQQNQARYREMLLSQIKQKQKQKQIIKKKEAEDDAKHQFQFYRKLKMYKQRDSKQNKNRNRIGGSVPRIAEYEGSSQQKYRFQNQRQLTLPSLQSPSISSSNHNDFSNRNFSIFNKKNYNIESQYLKNRSLFQIGSNLRRQNTNQQIDFHRSMDLDSSSQQFYNDKKQNNNLKRFDETQKKYRDLKSHLKAKQFEIYNLLQKSNEFIQGSKNPIRQLKKRLKTQPIYIPEDLSQDQENNYPLNYRVKTQFKIYNYPDEHKFYKLPQLKTANKSTIQQRSTNRSKQDKRSLDQQSSSIELKNHNEMMKIQQNPEVEGDQQIEENARFHVID